MPTTWQRCGDWPCAASPSVVLADEPTAALDSENGHAVMALLARIAREQHRCVLAVTHDPRTLSYADRVVRIEDGRIVRNAATVEDMGKINFSNNLSCSSSVIGPAVG